MIIFTKVRYKNFLSTGNYFNEIILDNSPSTLVMGKNGGGKSTFLDAICFGLFGKAFRNINKNQMINSINEKGTVVEIEFSIGSKEYMVRRGIKPNIFEIYLNGEFINQSADARDFQKKLEKTILKMNYKSFTQIVILGSSSFTPFMKLSSNNRRDVIEDILDIDIFSIMNTLLKERSSVLKTDMSQNDYDIKSLESGIEMKEEYIEKLKGTKKDRVESIKRDVQDCKNTICELQLQIDTKMKEIELIDIGDIGKLNDDLEKRVDVFKKMKNNKDRLKKENKFFTENNHCNTCHQDINEQLSSEIISKNENRISELDSAFIEIQKMITSVKDSIKVEQDKVDTVNKINTDILHLNQEIGFQNKSIEKYEKEIEFLKNKNDMIDGEYESLNKMKEQIQEAQQTKVDFLERNEIYNICSVLLKDTGIKTRIIKQYLPIMNKLINGYLNDFDFFANFNLDENFNEVIKSRHRDEFSYDSFSEGEKQRIDLAILFTWREVARMKNSVNTNLLILDEVFDSSLDAEGTENFMKVMNTLEGKGLNTFVISHKTDLLADKFDKQIKFEKIGNFSHKK